MQYLTISQCQLLNGYRHYVRGLFWLSIGYKRYALDESYRVFKNT